MNMRKRSLINSADPFCDESFLGYLLRLTELNHYDSLTWILRLAIIQVNPLGKLALISTGSPSDLKSLEQLTGIDQARLATLSYIPVANGGKVNDYRIFGNLVPRYTIRLRRPKICPRCLAETPYARKIWELAAVTACPIHKTLLESIQFIYASDERQER